MVALIARNVMMRLEKLLVDMVENHCDDFCRKEMREKYMNKSSGVKICFAGR